MNKFIEFDANTPTNLIMDRHLGGTTAEGDPDSYFPELWDWLVEHFKVSSMLDIGCGTGLTQKYFEMYHPEVETMGLEGSQKVIDYHLLKDKVVKHDLYTGPCCMWHPLDFYKMYDLVWSCELAEHVEQEFVGNVIQTVVLNCNKVVAFCAAPPGCGGYHHVNCQPKEYWIEKFEQAGLKYQPELTQTALDLCGGKDNLKGWPNKHRCDHNYFRRSGIILTRD